MAVEQCHCFQKVWSCYRTLFITFSIYLYIFLTEIETVTTAQTVYHEVRGRAGWRGLGWTPTSQRQVCKKSRRAFQLITTSILKIKRRKFGDLDVSSLTGQKTKQSLPRRTSHWYSKSHCLEKGIYIFCIFPLLLIIFIFIIIIYLKKEFKVNISFIALGPSIPKLLRLGKSLEVPTSFIKPTSLVTSNQMDMDSQLVITERYYFRNFLSSIFY